MRWTVCIKEGIIDEPLSVLRQGAALIPCLYLANRLAGLNGLIWAGAAADALSMVVGAALCLYQKRQIERAHTPRAYA